MKNNLISTGESNGLRMVLRALKHRNFRLFFAGQGISLIGTWMQSVALSWLVYRLTNSPFLLGVVGFSGQIPSFFLAPFAGVIADRYNRHRMLLITQSLSLIQATLLWLLVYTNTVTISHIIALALFMGFINSFDMPTRQSFIIQMIGNREDLGNAIALNSSMVNMARLVGPSIAGILIALAGEGICFLVNAISFLAVIASLLAMNITPRTATAQANSPVMSELREGVLYALRVKVIRNTILLVAMASLMGMPYMVLMPVFARDILSGGPHTLGFLMGAAGMGALCGALFLASRRTSAGLEKIIPVAAGLFGFGLVTFGMSHTYLLSLAFLLVTGLGMMVQLASSNTILQTLVEDDKRARVMSLYTMAFMGMAPFGNLMAGALADRIGAPVTVVMFGSLCILGAIVYALNIPIVEKQ